MVALMTGNTVYKAGTKEPLAYELTPLSDIQVIKEDMEICGEYVSEHTVEYTSRLSMPYHYDTNVFSRIFDIKVTLCVSMLPCH